MSGKGSRFQFLKENLQKPADEHRETPPGDKPLSSVEEAREMLEESNLPLFVSSIRRISAFQKAALQGVPVCNVKDPRAELGWQDYVAVGEEMMR